MASVRKGLPVLYAFGFERVGVVVGDLYFVDPNPREGEEEAEHGVRVELRVFGRGELKGTIYSAQPIEVGQPNLAGRPAGIGGGPPGQLRPHPPPLPRSPARSGQAGLCQGTIGRPARLAGHPTGRPGRAAGLGRGPGGGRGPSDAEDLRRAAGEIVDATRRLLDKIRSGELGSARRCGARRRRSAGWRGGQRGPAPFRAGWL